MEKQQCCVVGMLRSYLTSIYLGRHINRIEYEIEIHNHIDISADRYFSLGIRHWCHASPPFNIPIESETFPIPPTLLTQTVIS